MRRARLIQDPRRDAAALVGLAGLVAYVAVPLLLGRICELPTALGVPALMLAPAVLVAPIVIRSGRGRAVAAALGLYVVLFAVEVLFAFFVALDHCGLELGLDALR